MNNIPNHIKEKILLFFLKTSVPRIIAEEQKKIKEVNIYERPHRK